MQNESSSASLQSKPQDSKILINFLTLFGILLFGGLVTFKRESNEIVAGVVGLPVVDRFFAMIRCFHGFKRNGSEFSLSDHQRIVLAGIPDDSLAGSGHGYQTI